MASRPCSPANHSPSATGFRASCPTTATRRASATSGTAGGASSSTPSPASRSRATRLFEGTGWRPRSSSGETVLEVGCGAGRFTEVLLDAGAEVWAVDASAAVDAAAATVARARRTSASRRPTSSTCRSRRAPFDRVLCYGVLQHTPDPRARVPRVATHAPAECSRPTSTAGGRYVDRWSAKSLWRPLTTRLPRARLRRIVEWYVPRWLPVDTRLARVPKIGRFLVAVVPCWNYTGLFPLATTSCARGPCSTRSTPSRRATTSRRRSRRCRVGARRGPRRRRRALRRERDRRHPRTPAAAPASRTSALPSGLLDVEQVPELEHQQRPEALALVALARPGAGAGSGRRGPDGTRPCRARCSSASSRSASGRSSPRSQRGEREHEARASAPRGARA